MPKVQPYFFFATETTEFLEKNLKISVRSVANFLITQNQKQPRQQLLTTVLTAWR